MAQGEKPQKTDVVDVAALQMEQKFGLNNEIIYDRTRFVMHLNGMKWVGTPAAESPTNAELGTIANWNLVLATANRVGRGLHPDQRVIVWPDKPKVDPYPEPVAMTAINLRRINRMQAEKGRAERLQRLARRNRDVAWLLAEHQTGRRSPRPRNPQS